MELFGSIRLTIARYELLTTVVLFTVALIGTALVEVLMMFVKMLVPLVRLVAAGAKVMSEKLEMVVSIVLSKLLMEVFLKPNFLTPTKREAIFLKVGSSIPKMLKNPGMVFMARIVLLLRSDPAAERLESLRMTVRILLLSTLAPIPVLDGGTGVI